MKLSVAFAIGLFFASVPDTVATKTAVVTGDEEALLQADRAIFGTGSLSTTFGAKLFDPNFTWTDSSGTTRNKSEIMQRVKSGKGLPMEAGDASDGDKILAGEIRAHTYGQVGVVQRISGNLYTLRIWVKRGANWQLLIYQAVSIGASQSVEPATGECENPCKTVPFQPRTADEGEVITAYQEVERAVTAHNSAAWAAHIADEFFAVTSNSNRPLDKATRMAGLDNQKVAGIAPFPLVSARMLAFGGVMVMTSRQQPAHGLPLHVTRVWFKRDGKWLEGYSYQTTIQVPISTR